MWCGIKEMIKGSFYLFSISGFWIALVCLIVGIWQGNTLIVFTAIIGHLALLGYAIYLCSEENDKTELFIKLNKDYIVLKSFESYRFYFAFFEGRREYVIFEIDGYRYLVTILDRKLSLAVFKFEIDEINERNAYIKIRERFKGGPTGEWNYLRDSYAKSYISMIDFKDLIKEYRTNKEQVQ